MKLGVSVPIVSRWERGLNTPRRAVAGRVDKLLGAKGALLAAWGYVSPHATDEVGLRAQVAELTELVERLQEQVVAVRDALRIPPASHQSEPPAPES